MGGSVSAHGMGNTLAKARSMLKVANRFWSIIYSHLDNIFFRDVAAYSSRTTVWIHSKRVRAQDWPACSPDRSPIENVLDKNRTTESLEC